MEVGPAQTIHMSMRTVVSLAIIVAVAAAGFYRLQEQLNRHQTQLELAAPVRQQNSAFRVGWPRGLLGSLPADREQFLLLKHLDSRMKAVESQLVAGLLHEGNIARLRSDMDKLGRDIEELEDRP